MRANCPKRTCDATDALYGRFKKGDDEARQELITHSIPIVVATVDNYLRRFKALEYMRDDLVSEGFVELVKLVDAMIRRDIKKPMVYISRSLVYAIGRLGRKVRDPSGETECDAFGPDSSEAIDVLDELDAACLTSMDRHLVELRRAGYTFHEIAEEVGMSRQSVQRDFNAIQDRFEKREKLLSI